MNLENFKKQKLPGDPGVYFFLDKRKKILYIGKATSLKDRVKSYFSSDLIDTRGKLLVKMVVDAHSIEFRKTESVLEALLLEADLIKKFKPTYNTKEKDDKSFNCVVITKEDFPQVLIIRKKDIDFKKLTANSLKLKAVFGPFTNGAQLKEALKIVRKIFPYRDEKCHIQSKVQSEKSKVKSRACFNYSIGLCPGTCIGAVDKHCYAIRIRRIEKFLAGDIRAVVKDLEKDMTALAKEKNFEAAKILRDKIYALQHINDISLIKNDLQANQLISSQAFRIESYDIAHMAGDNMVGVMTVVTNGIADKNQYRKFKIKTVDRSNDPKALGEIITRRLAHTEWQIPNLIVVDGGVAQRNVAESIVEKANLSIPVLSVVKDEKHQPKDVLGDQTLAIKYRKEILLSNAEAHRFAIGYHKKIRRRNFLS